MHVDRDRPSVGVERRFEPADPHGPVFSAESHIFFTGPQDLHRPAVESLRDGNGLTDLIGAAAVAKSATEESRVEKDLVRRDAGFVRRS